MTTSIFIRSYRTDRFWLEYCLRSLEKFARGFEEIVVALPVGDEPHFEGYDFRGAKCVWVQDPRCDGYLAQQVSKMQADYHCRGEAILYLDSDCFVTGALRPEMFFCQGKPIQLLRHWGDLPTNAQQWKPITQEVVGFEPMFEAMACAGLIYDRRTLALVRSHLESTHRQPLHEWVAKIQCHRLSEFNAIGSVAHRFQPYLYDFRLADPATDNYPRAVAQRWSYQEGGVDRHRDEYERTLAA